MSTCIKMLALVSSFPGYAAGNIVLTVYSTSNDSISGLFVSNATCPPGTTILSCACQDPGANCGNVYIEGNNCLASPRREVRDKTNPYTLTTAICVQSVDVITDVFSALNGTSNSDAIASCPEGLSLTGCVLSQNSGWLGDNFCGAAGGIQPVSALARCANIPEVLQWVNVRGNISTTDDDAVSIADCPLGATLTACICEGTCNGAESDGNSCIAHNSASGSGIWAWARCAYFLVTSLLTLAPTSAPAAAPTLDLYYVGWHLCPVDSFCHVEGKCFYSLGDADALFQQKYDGPYATALMSPGCEVLEYYGTSYLQEVIQQWCLARECQEPASSTLDPFMSTTSAPPLAAEECQNGFVRAIWLDGAGPGYSFYPEIFFNGSWYPICSECIMNTEYPFGLNLVCKALGFDHEWWVDYEWMYVNGSYTDLKTPLSVDAVMVGQCSPNDTDLTDCSSDMCPSRFLEGPNPEGSSCAQGVNPLFLMACNGTSEFQYVPCMVTVPTEVPTTTTATLDAGACVHNTNCDENPECNVTDIWCPGSGEEEGCPPPFCIRIRAATTTAMPVLASTTPTLVPTTMAATRETSALPTLTPTVTVTTAAEQTAAPTSITEAVRTSAPTLTPTLVPVAASTVPTIMRPTLSPTATVTTAGEQTAAPTSITEAVRTSASTLTTTLVPVAATRAPTYESGAASTLAPTPTVSITVEQTMPPTRTTTTPTTFMLTLQGMVSFKALGEFTMCGSSIVDSILRTVLYEIASVHAETMTNRCSQTSIRRLGVLSNRRLTSVANVGYVLLVNNWEKSMITEHFQHVNLTNLTVATNSVLVNLGVNAPIEFLAVHEPLEVAEVRWNYSWSVSDWSPCSMDCGRQTRTRNISCAGDGDDSDMFCLFEGVRPTQEEQCHVTCPFDIMCPFGNESTFDCASQKILIVALFVSLLSICGCCCFCCLAKCCRPPRAGRITIRDSARGITITSTYKTKVAGEKTHIVWDTNDDDIERFFGELVASEVAQDEPLPCPVDEALVTPTNCSVSVGLGELGGAADDAVSHMQPAYLDGSAVEYFSLTHTTWLAGVVQVVCIAGKSIHYNVELPGGQVRLDVMLDDLRRPLAMNEPLEIFCKRRGGKWIPCQLSGLILPKLPSILGYHVRLEDGSIIERVPSHRLRRSFGTFARFHAYLGWKVGVVGCRVERCACPHEILQIGQDVIAKLEHMDVEMYEASSVPHSVICGLKNSISRCDLGRFQDIGSSWTWVFVRIVLGEGSQLSEPLWVPSFLLIEHTGTYWA